MDDNHHPALITKGNSGSLTFNDLSPLISVRSSGRIFDRLRVSASHLTSDSLTVSTDLLVPIHAFDKDIIPIPPLIGKIFTSFRYHFKGSGELSELELRI